VESHPDAPPTRLWTVAVALLILIAGMLALGEFVLQGYVMLSSRALLAGGVAPPPEQAGQFFATLPGLLLAGTLSAAWIGLVVLVCGALSPTPFPVRLGLLPGRLGPLAWIVVALGGLAVNQAVDATFHLTGFGRGPVLDEMMRALAGARGPALGLALLVIGVLSATCEELFFRGYLQRRLVARLGAAPGILLTALAFGLVHWDVHHSLFAFVFGLFLGWASYVADSTWPAIVAHAINNTTSVLALVLGLDDGATSALTQGFLLIASVAVIALAIAWLARRAARADAEGVDRTTLLRSGA